MREPSHNAPLQNRACVCITSQLYDRRALDAPVGSTPLISSLTHLGYLTSTSPRIRETLTLDGGLERLVAVALSGLEQLQNTHRPVAELDEQDRARRYGGRFRFYGWTPPDRTSTAISPRGERWSSLDKRTAEAEPCHLRSLMLTFTLALQSLVNVGVRGSEAVRTRSVEAGVLSVAQRILCGFFNEQEAASKLRRAREEEEERVAAHASLAQPNLSRLNATSALSSLHTTAVPSRTATPDGLPSSSASSIAADDAAASSSDGEADEHYPTGAMSRRSRSATIKEATPVAAPAGGASDLPGDMELDRAEQQDDDALLPPDPPNADPGHGYTEPRYSCYREDDLLSCLQLLAYLSKYPHVRVAFHHPALDFACGDAAFLHQLDAPAHKEALLAALNANATPSRSTNVFSLVERYTVRPSSTDKDRSPPTPLRYLPDVGYWAGVIMRNACRKDEHRGGIRQCANMACGAWETYPREFAKCRRCRKAKYCSKVCQSAAWQGGHRYWCSARDAEHEQQPSKPSPMLTYQPPYRGALRPLASLPEQDANTLARYLETRPHLAANPESIAWLVRRYTTRQQRHTDRPRTPLQPRPRAVTLPGNMNPLPAHIDPTPPNLLRGAAYLDDDDDEDVPLHPLEAHADTMVHIAELDPLNDHAADLRVIAPDADLPML